MKLLPVIIPLSAVFLSGCGGTGDENMNYARSCRYDKEYRIELCRSNGMEDCTDLVKRSLDFDFEGSQYVMEENRIVSPGEGRKHEDCQWTYSGVGGHIDSCYSSVEASDIVMLTLYYSLEYDPGGECGE